MTRWQFFQTILAAFLPWKKLVPAPVAPSTSDRLARESMKVWYALDMSRDYCQVDFVGRGEVNTINAHDYRLPWSFTKIAND